MKSKEIAWTFGLAAALGAGAVQGGVVYTNLGAGDSFNTVARYIVGNVATGAAYQVAAQFMPTTNAIFRSAELALSYNSGANSYSVTLMDDDTGRPGSAIETLMLTGVGTTAGIYGVDSVSTPTLIAGLQYWLTIFPTSASTIDWYQNNQGDLELAWGDPPPPWSGHGFSAVAPAFRINDTPLNNVPEPVTIALMGLGLAGIGYQRHRGKKAA